MTLEDIFMELTYGELSQLVVGGRENEEPGITEEDRPQIIRHVSTALTAIFTRFRLLERQTYIQLVDGKSHYIMDPKFVVGAPISGDYSQYIIDTENEPFEDSLIKIEDVFALSEQLGLPVQKNNPWRPLLLNVQGNPYSLRTSSLKTLVVPDQFGYELNKPKMLMVKYQSNHPPIDMDLAIAAPIAVPIMLPTTHLQALLFHVASRISNPIGMVEEFNSGNNYYAKYESEAQRLEMENIEIDNQGPNTNFERQGFR